MNDGRNGGYFSFEKLDVYRVSRELVSWVHQDLFLRLPRGAGSVRDQLNRASESVMLNIAEGAEQETPGKARQHYRHAKASAGECFAALDKLGLTGVGNLELGVQLTRRLGAMLRRMAN